MNIGIDLSSRAGSYRRGTGLIVCLVLWLGACSNTAQKPVADTVDASTKAIWWPVCDGLHVDASLTVKFPRLYHPGTHCNIEHDLVGQPETHFNYWAATMADLPAPIDVIALDGAIYNKPITINDLPATGTIERATGAHRIGFGEEQTLSSGDTTIRTIEMMPVDNIGGNVCVLAAKDYPNKLLSISLCRRIPANANDDQALIVARDLVHQYLPQITLKGTSSPTTRGKPIEAALTNPTIFCDRILLGGALAANIKALNTPSKCEPVTGKITTGVRLSASGWVGAQKDSIEAGHSVIMNVSLIDMPIDAVPEATPSDLQLGDDAGIRRELILPDLATDYSSGSIKIGEIIKVIDPAHGLNWAQVQATIRLSPRHILLVLITRPVDMRAGDAAVFARARAIIENDLPQISAKP